MFHQELINSWSNVSPSTDHQRLIKCSTKCEHWLAGVTGQLRLVWRVSDNHRWSSGLSPHGESRRAPKASNIGLNNLILVPYVSNSSLLVPSFVFLGLCLVASLSSLVSIRNRWETITQIWMRGPFLILIVSHLSFKSTFSNRKLSPPLCFAVTGLGWISWQNNGKWKM